MKSLSLICGLIGELELHVLAGDGREERAQAAQAAEQRGAASAGGAGGGAGQAARVPSAAGREARLEGHVLADGDLRLLVVAGEDVRRGEHVHVRALLERVQHHAEGGDVDAQLLQLGDGRALQAGEEAAEAGQVRQRERRRQARAGVLGAQQARHRRPGRCAACSRCGS